MLKKIIWEKFEIKNDDVTIDVAQCVHNNIKYYISVFNNNNI